MTEYVLSLKLSRETGGHDSSAALFKDGELSFAAEVERYTRKKHNYTNEFPYDVVCDCLDCEEISIQDVDILSIPVSPELYLKKEVPDDIKNWLPSVIRDDIPWLGKLYKIVKRAIFRAEQCKPRKIIKNKVESEFGFCPSIKFIPHHKSHAASAFYPTKFDEALIFTIDGQGEYDSTVIWEADQDSIERLKTYTDNNSLGQFFSAITEFLGFRRDNGEGKVMGLAPYGERNKHIQRTLGNKLTAGIDYDTCSIYSSDDICDILGWEESDNTDSFTQNQKDLAFFAQEFLENTVKDIISTYINKTGINNIGLAGGVVLNCKMNKEIVELPDVADYFIQPVANDAGLPLGAGWESASVSSSEIDQMQHTYYGPKYRTKEIQSLLNEAKIEYYQPDNLFDDVVDRLDSQEIVGWFQNRMEFGPRALGNRSILADPRTDQSRSNINKYVKHREQWRPFAPSMTADAAERYLKGDRKSPFMIDTFETHSVAAEEIPAVLHPADLTTRPHIVTRANNTKYYKLIKKFGERTGVPVVLNTSFNDHGEPIVRTPAEALRSFYSIGLDVLVLNDYIVEKNPAG